MSEDIRHCAIPEEILLDNRERYKGEIAQAIYRLMCDQSITRSRLAKMLGCNRSRITHMLSGEKDNFQADTIADVFLILGRAAHLTLGVDPTEFRLPVDEGRREGHSESTEITTQDMKYGGGTQEDVEEESHQKRDWIRDSGAEEESDRIQWPDFGRGASRTCWVTATEANLASST